MADRLLMLSQNPVARRVISTLGLPLPLPERLARTEAPWSERELDLRPIAVGGVGPLGPVLASTLAREGASVSLVDVPPEPFAAAAEAWGRPLAPTVDRPHALVLDASAFSSLDELGQLYAFFHPRLRDLARSGRVVVLGRPEAGSPEGAAVQRALEGFVRSVGREIGRRGATALLVTVEEGAEDRVPGVLRFLLSPRSAYVSGQVVRVSKTVRAREGARVRPLEGQVALVTGAARGIGAATARALAREGARVVVLDRPADDGPASAVASEIGGRVVLADLADPAAPAAIAAQLGAVDVIVHNAGVTRDKTLVNMDPERWDATLAVNLTAVVRLTEALLPEMPSHGRIVCLSSIAGIAGNVGQTNYATSKAGVIGYVEALSAKLARRGIAVNAVAPGFIETRLTDAIPVATREVARRLSNLGQGGLPEDVAEVITWLASPAGSALCGQTLRVCGGNFVGA